MYQKNICVPNRHIYNDCRTIKANIRLPIKHNLICNATAKCDPASARLVVLNLYYKYLSCVPGVDGKIHPEGVVQHRR